MARDLSPQELERVLVDIGARLEAPPPVDLAPVVAARLLEAGRAPAARVIPFRRPSRRLGLTWRSVAAAAAAVVVLAAGILAFSPSARRAVAGWLGLRGVRIEVTPTPPRPSLGPGGQALNLGPRVSLTEAEREVGFRILLPRVPELGTPDEVHVQTLFLHDQVFLVYRARPGLPPTEQTGVGLLVSEFRAATDEGFLKKLSGAEGSVEFVRVKGEPGYWIRGLHEVGYVDPAGNLIADTLRLAENVLLWEHGDLTLRLEGSFSKDEAIRIARSFG